jgi:uncharacterized protein
MIIGRKKEIILLDEIINSSNSCFVAVYGRRRVGKTFLIRETFANQFAFYVSGASKGNTKRQLSNFYDALLNFGADKSEIPKDWFQAFKMLSKLMENNSSSRKIIFIDEMPWLDTPRSEFLSALESFWNQWASARKDIVLIACGSATSWIIKKIVNDHGGLHNRITHHIYLHPFTISETEQFLQARSFQLNRYQIIQTYMVLGGIPYYLDCLRPHLSITQNIDEIFFSATGILRNEFQNLFQSLFKNAEKHLKVIEALSKKDRALSRNEIAKLSKISNGGGLTVVLEELELCDFISKTYPFQGNVNGALYQIKDAFTLFYYRFMFDAKHIKPNFWINNFDSPAYRQWSGVAFEKVCFNHVTQICKALSIAGVKTVETSWRDNNAKPKTQIDLLIDRKDQVINLCEIKFSEGAFTIEKSYAEKLRNRLQVFKSHSQTNKAVFLTMITTYPMIENAYSKELIVNKLTMNDLFDS